MEWLQVNYKKIFKRYSWHHFVFHHVELNCIYLTDISHYIYIFYVEKYITLRIYPFVNKINTYNKVLFLTLFIDFWKMGCYYSKRKHHYISWEHYRYISTDIYNLNFDYSQNILKKKLCRLVFWDTHKIDALKLA